MSKIGVLGGTFDPIHDGHLALGQAACDLLKLDRVLFVPAARPPHKVNDRVTDAAIRCEMVQLAIAGNTHFELSRAELDRPGLSYTIDTLRDLAATAELGKPHELYLILSVESLLGFHEWEDPSAILDLARVAALPRPGTPTPDRAWLTRHFPGREDRFLYLDGFHLSHASRELRALAARGRSLRYLVPGAVADYIKKTGLYLDRPELVLKRPIEPDDIPVDPAT
ncbi:MAG: nicotinate-nucleotide adenylyltransferase [Chloroflexota bacterium]